MLSPRCIKQLSDLLGIKCFPKDNWEALEEASIAQGKASELAQCVEYLTAHNLNSFNRLIFATREAVTTELLTKPAYQQIDLQALANERMRIWKLLSYLTISKRYAIKQHFGKHFISIDIAQANFAMVKQLGLADGAQNGPSWIAQFVPAGEWPRCLLESKHLRLVALGELTRLRRLWELEILRFVERIKDLLKDRIVVINSDEVVFSVESYEQGAALLSSIAVNAPFKASVFRLDPIDLKCVELSGHPMNDACVKRNSDGSWRLMGVSSPYYNLAVRACQ